MSIFARNGEIHAIHYSSNVCTYLQFHDSTVYGLWGCSLSSSYFGSIMQTAETSEQGSEDNYQSTTAIHQRLRILPLSRRRYVHTNNFAYKRSIQPKYIDNRNLLTRAHGKNLLLCPRPRTERFKNSVVYTTAKCWNELSLDEQHASSYNSFIGLKRRKGNWENCWLLKREHTILIVSC